MLHRTLLHLESQERIRSDQWEVLIVDNNSTDHTRTVFEYFQTRGLLPGLRYLFEPLQGRTHALRRGVSESNFRFMAIVDDDCLLDHNWLSETLAFIARHPHVGLFGGRVSLLWEAPPGQLALDHEVMLAKQDLGAVPRELRDDLVVGAGSVVNLDALRICGGMERIQLTTLRGEHLSSGEDIEMALNLRGAGFAIWYTPSLKLQHVIPAYRSTMQYLERLAWAHGNSLLQLRQAAGAPTTPYSALRFIVLTRKRQLRLSLPEWLNGKRLSQRTRDHHHLQRCTLRGERESYIHWWHARISRTARKP